jgi:hypothetical protein
MDDAVVNRPAVSSLPLVIVSKRHRCDLRRIHSDEHCELVSTCRSIKRDQTLWRAS